jgi:hypothetical protein
MSARKPGAGRAYEARLERHIRRRRAATQQPAPALTPAQKTASEPRLYRACVAQPQHFQTVQEDNHARLL